jgi:hypothetical protein
MAGERRCGWCGRVMHRVHSATWLMSYRNELVGYIEWCQVSCRDSGEEWLELERRRRGRVES